MKSGDILTVLGAILVVIVVALAANPHYLSSILPISSPSPSPAPVSTTIPTAARTTLPLPVPTLSQTGGPSSAVNPPYRIFYTDKPLSYPVFKLPDSLATFGASDIPLRTDELVTFAYIEDTRGGLTQTFSVPYPVWVLNTTVIANATPQYGSFRMALCSADTGKIIKGQEILNRGSAYHVVQVSNTPLYMIVSTAYIDRYRINLQTTRSYYDQYKPR